MNEKIIKPAMVQKIAKQLKSNGKRYSQEAVNDILSAFLDELVEATENGDSIVFNGYFIIEPQLWKERKRRDIYNNKEVVVPEHYKPHFKAGGRLMKAAQSYTEKMLLEEDE